MAGDYPLTPQQVVGKDFAPFVWTIAVRPDAHSAQEGVIQHSWNHPLNRWQRFPLSHISEANRVGMANRFGLHLHVHNIGGQYWKWKPMWKAPVVNPGDRVAHMTGVSGSSMSKTGSSSGATNSRCSGHGSFGGFKTGPSPACF